MKKGSFISLLIALIAIAGALLGLVAYLRSRRCCECADTEEDCAPMDGSEGDYDMDYYVDSQPIAGEVPFPENAPTEDTTADDVID